MTEGEIGIGTKLEQLGWRQGGVVKGKDVCNLLMLATGNLNQKKKWLNAILTFFGLENQSQDKSCTLDSYDNIVLIVASQSCDIASNNIDDDPFIEFSIARVIEKTNGNLTFNKNPRVLHTELLHRTENSDISNSVFLQLLAFEKIQIKKSDIIQFSPDENMLLVNEQLRCFVAWLASRYSRPALPSSFNDKIAEVDSKNKRKKKAKSIDNILSGIYVEIIPDKEINTDENYKVNLLGLIASDFDGDLSKAEVVMAEYAKIMESAGMDVVVSVKSEDEISITVIKRFKRFYYDDLSLKSGTEVPPETQMNI
jgi:hypothetical protein